MSKLTTEKEYRWILELAELIRYMYYNRKEKRICKNSINTIINYLEICKRNYKYEKNLNLHISFCWELLQWIKKEEPSSEYIYEKLLEIGQAYEDEAEYKTEENKNHILTKRIFCSRQLIIM